MTGLGMMDEIKIKYCREHWQHLAPHVKERATAKHLLAALEIAERLLRENNKLEMENRTMRMMPNRPHERRRGQVTLEFARGVRPRLSLHAVVERTSKGQK